MLLMLVGEFGHDAIYGWVVQKMHSQARTSIRATWRTPEYGKTALMRSGDCAGLVILGKWGEAWMLVDPCQQSQNEWARNLCFDSRLSSRVYSSVDGGQYAVARISWFLSLIPLCRCTVKPVLVPNA